MPYNVHITEEYNSRNFARVIIIELCERIADLLIPITAV